MARRLFPPATLEPENLLLDEIDGVRPGVRYLVWDEGGVRGFVRAARLSVGTLVVHLGVHPAWQGRGVGSSLLGAVREAGGDAPIFAEVEPGAPMGWWSARGARVVWPDYVQPALRPETDPVPMYLMALGEVSDAGAAARAIHGEFYLVGQGR